MFGRKLGAGSARVLGAVMLTHAAVRGISF
jgi:hypothetical protein